MKTIINYLIFTWLIASTSSLSATPATDNSKDAKESEESSSAPAAASSSSAASFPAIGKISGKLIDETSEEPLLFASVVVYRERDSLMVTGGISDEAGHFLIDQVPLGRYYISVNYVGYPRKKVNGVTITPRDLEHDFGIIRLQPTSAMLNEVTIEASRELMEVGLDRRVYNVGQELTATGGTAVEVMQNIPSVAVDFDGNVSLRGSSNVTILIDGRPSTLTGMSGSDALQQIPSNMIERVEVITNPSARFTPDGTSGIINIVLKKERRPGYNGVVSLTGSTNYGYTGSLNLNYKVNRVNFFANYSGRLFNSDGYGSSFRTSFLSETSFLDQQMDFENTMNSQNASIGADFDIDRYNTMTLSAMYNKWGYGGTNITDFSSLNDLMTLTNYFNRISDSDMAFSGMNYVFNYRRTFPERVRELNADITFSNPGITRNEENIQRFFNPDKSPNGLPDLMENTRLAGNNWMFSAQLDYVHPLGDDSKLEFGGRASMREMDADFNFFGFDHGMSAWINNVGLSNRFVFGEQVYAAYTTYSTMLGSYSLQAGLRLEQAYIEADQRTTSEAYNNSFLNLFPTFHLRRSFENNQSAQISYSRRVNRPNNRVLNPFVRYANPYDLSFGNPRLSPELINSMELGYTRFWTNTTLNPSIFYRYTEGMITRFRTMDEDGIAYTTFENINNGTSYGAELVATQQLFPWFRMNGTFSYFRQIVEGRGGMMEMRSDSYSWSARLVNNLTFSRGWSAQVNAFYRSPVVLFQGEMQEMFGADAAVRKNVLANRGTITLRVSDIFNSMRFGMYNYGDNFTIDMERVRNSRMIYLGFSYRINEVDRRSQQRSRRPSGMDGGGMMDLDDF